MLNPQPPLSLTDKIIDACGLLILGVTLAGLGIQVLEPKTKSQPFDQNLWQPVLHSGQFDPSTAVLSPGQFAPSTANAFLADALPPSDPTAQNQPALDQNTAKPVLRSGDIVPDQSSVVPDAVDQSPSDPTAQFNIGVQYYEGQGVPQDYAQAAQWYRKAADQGYAYAQHNLGVMYFEGRGVPKDDAQAMMWFRKAADQGNAYAQYAIGRLYYGGWGVPQGYAQAMMWFRKAADQGNAYAQNNLARMHHEGQGVPQDYAQAAQWYLIAKASGLSVIANQNLQQLEALATPAQITEAQRMAGEWWSAHHPGN